MALESQLQYLRRVDDLIRTLESQLTPREVADVRHLVDHGEPPEGLCTLAWIIQNENKQVSVETKRLIVELTGGLVAREHLPESFREYVSP
jgi:hypothetical protein